MARVTTGGLSAPDKGMISEFLKDIVKNKYIYMMAIPVILYYFIFQYGPMYGAIIAFKEYNPRQGILGSPWVGLKNFYDFFSSVYFGRLLSNTLLISFYDLIFGFPAPIILALMLNEVRKNSFKRIVQTVTYMPHFISIMVVCGIVVDFTAKNGIINDFLSTMGFARVSLLLKPEMFRPIYVSSNIWQQVGWGSIVYLAALTSVDQELYEAARIDGAGRWKQTIHITLPGIMQTIVVMLILRIGAMMNVGFEKIILLYNPLTYQTGDVISSFVYRQGILQANYSYSTAIGLFNSLINFLLVVFFNKISKKISGSGLW